MSQTLPPSSPAMVNQKASTAKPKSNWLVRKYGKRVLKQNIPLYIMFVPIILFFFIFKYYPMTGLVIAFKKYSFH
jgi:putative aldouronate transport system permease protein